MTNAEQMGRRRSQRGGRWATMLVGLLAAGLVGAPTASAAFGDNFGLVPGSFDAVASNTVDPNFIHNANPGDPATQAGSHPSYLTTRLAFNSTESDTGDLTPEGNVRQIDVDLPPGMVVNPKATPTCDRGTLFESIVDATRPCPSNTQIGVVIPTVMFGGPGLPLTRPLYNLTPAPGKPAEFGFTVSTTAVIVSGGVTNAAASDGGYRMSARLNYVSNALPILDTSLTLWGVPADPRHNAERGMCLETGETNCTVDAPRRALLTNPSRCDGPNPVTDIAVTPWQHDRVSRDAYDGAPGTTGCDRLPFEPTVDVEPDNQRAGAPAGLSVDIGVPFSDVPESLATPPLKNVEVALPEGMAISPSAADGLGACTDAQLGLRSDAEESCPGSSRIGSLTIDTPLLSEPLTGSVYLGTQESNDPMSGDMYRMFMVAEGQGVRIKLRGAITANPETGQLTTRFLDTPQMPFSRMRVQLKGGARAPLVNPTSCGTKTSSTTLKSWAGQQVTRTSDFTIDQACPTGAFAPTFSAGTVNPMAGAFSPFTMTVSRTDADQELKAISLALPSGLLATLSTVPLCAEAQAAAGSCGEESRVGSTTVSAGPGANPYSLGGAVYMGGPYKGAPFSLSIVVRAKAGPIDLGLVVVRSPLNVDAANAKVAAPADPLPTILGGIPLKIRTINIALDRPNFMFNATSCAPQSIGGTLTSTAGTAVNVASRYQAQGCSSLKLDPTLKMSFTGKSEMKKGGHPGVVAELSQTFGQAGLKGVKVDLPLAVALEADNAQGLCTPAQAAARACPESSIVGRATARTPALHQPLSGPVYFVEGTRLSETGKTIKTLPKLWLKLEGQGVPLDLWADSDVTARRLTTTFRSVPDAPIAAFRLEIDGGKHGILGATANVCDVSRAAGVTFDGQNGARVRRSIAIGADSCAMRVVKTTQTPSRTALRISGLNGPGRLTLTGKGVSRSSRNISSATVASIGARLTASARRDVARGRAVRIRLTASFTPKGAKAAQKITRTVTVKKARARR